MADKLKSMAAWLLRVALGRSAARAAVASFAAAILVGSVLLILPISSRARQWTAPDDALFTVTSAVCVTGLIVKSTPNYWSLFGQLVILILIQAGGLGIMTLGAFLAFMLQRRLSMRFETVMSDIVDVHQVESVWTLIRFICVFTLVAETAGAAALFLSWGTALPRFGERLYHSVFHSVSAFCNAGFSLNDDNLMHFVDSVPVNLVVCLLIVSGGLGFTVMRDLMRWARWWLHERKGRRPRLATHSKVVLTVTGILLLVGFLGVLVIESDHVLAGKSVKTKLLAAMFQSVTPRTAGFNTIEMSATALAPATTVLLMVLMYIGGSPGGTAGGIKTSTLGIMIASIAATLRGRSRAELFNHSVPEEAVHRVASIILLSVAALVGGVFLLVITEAASFHLVVFDAVSALGTVGLSIGLTGPDTALTPAGKLILTTLMFVGRLGSITLVLSVASLRERAVYRYPEEQVLVG
jgi:trk system potassium uptake protein TrkH